jgi:hypothetical protein
MSIWVGIEPTRRGRADIDLGRHRDLDPGERRPRESAIEPLGVFFLRTR